VRESIEEKQYEDVNAAAKKTAEVISKCAAQVREATSALRAP
jgi:hypothetical protein